MTKSRRSTGSAVTPRQTSTLRNPDKRAASQAADIAAVDRGDVIRVVPCDHRGDYGEYPRRFRGYRLDLEPERPVIRASLWRRIPVREQILSARVRPFRGDWESRRRGGNQEFSLEKRVIIECMTTGGTLDFGVGVSDVDLVLHYLNRLASAAAPPAPDATGFQGLGIDGWFCFRLRCVVPGSGASQALAMPEALDAAY